LTGNVVITGASRGIGGAYALELDRLGFRVFAGVRTVADAGAFEQKARPAAIAGRLMPDRLRDLYLCREMGLVTLNMKEAQQ
jgi:NAD(P)-dependent dehydrogenase (short-subunit alcohol dehydrogenase family)